VIRNEEITSGVLRFFSFFFFINSNFALGVCAKDDVSSSCYVPEPEPLCVIEIGDFCSQSMGGWGTSCNGNNPGCLRDNYWNEVIGENLTVGIGYNITFTAPQFVETFLPDGGSSSVLTQSYVNPTSLGNTFASQVIALKLNVLFSDANIGLSTPNLEVSIGELYVIKGKFKDLTVYELLELAEKVLGGDSVLLNDYSASISDLNNAVDAVNNNFVDCEKNKKYLEWRTCEEEPQPFCGDGVVNQPSEQCDGEDGLIQGFYCTNDCKLLPLKPVCPLNEDDYDYIVDFSGRRLRSDTASGEFTPFISVSIPKGDYNITLVGHDAYLSRKYIFQPYEQFKLGFYKDGSLIAESNPHDDLEDYVSYVKLIQQVNTAFSLTTDVDAVRGIHAVYPHTDPNSLNAVCAGLKLVEEEPEPVLGSLKVCKVLYDEFGYLVSGEGLNVNFTLPLHNFSDVVFNVPLVYDDYLNCVVYDELDLGVYLFDEEIIDSDDEFVLWNAPLYKLNGEFETFTDGVIELTEDYPNKTLIIKNKFVVEEPEPVLSSLKVCKVIYNESGHLVSGEGLNVNFTLPLHNFSDVVFNVPLVYDDYLNCVVYDELDLGVYLFDEEIIDSDDEFVYWNAPLYKLNGEFETFTDGVIELTEDYPNKTLIIKNKFVVEEPEPVLGSLKVCKVLYDEFGYLVSGEGLNVNFTLPLHNFSDVIFNVPLMYDDDLNCIVYDELDLGVYLFDEEIISSNDEFVYWNTPLYKLNGYFETFTDGVIQLTEETPNKTLIIKNKFYINETTPKINKKIGLPKLPMTLEDIELGYLFFNEQKGFDPALTVEFCDLKEENCVEVTLETEINLGCKDAETNQTLNASVYFKVHWDGDDLTQEYCELQDGIMMNDYCFVENGVSSFYFQEESWHRLEYYCEYTGKSSEVDIEYFKVKGTSFTIHLNKKWNLISIPYQLTNNSPEAVFGSLNNVMSVWTYDSTTEKWISWAPNAPSNMAEVKPGWGYWVLMNATENITLGGSLFNPITVPPSKKIVNGWNLVGYYGTDGLLSYKGPLGQGKTAGCVFKGLEVSEITAPLSSINTYWEPYNPNSWLYLNETSNLDPGAGYWIFSKVNSFYTPTGPC
jgi:uncharacterized protein YlzI (FlbEa/FlbD family)